MQRKLPENSSPFSSSCRVRIDAKCFCVVPRPILVPFQHRLHPRPKNIPTRFNCLSSLHSIRPRVPYSPLHLWFRARLKIPYRTGYFCSIAVASALRLRLQYPSPTVCILYHCVPTPSRPTLSTLWLRSATLVYVWLHLSTGGRRQMLVYVRLRSATFGYVRLPPSVYLCLPLSTCVDRP
ncbi:hypothetical protein DFH06DRAFT_236623 [Mycena polygramma]|nr:hypothetical protein DFH06DRAFT_236623 [Mycena polygramma]